MALLIRLAIVASCVSAACYSPKFSDCAAACASDSDCAPSQVCGSDRLCAIPSLAGRCAERAIPDAAATADAALGDTTPPLDAPQDAAIVADSQPDAPASVELWVEINGPGKVDVAGQGTCFAGTQPCSYTVTAGVAITLSAMPYPDAAFDKWQDACDGQDEICTLVPTLPTTKAKARFEGDDDD